MKAPSIFFLFRLAPQAKHCSIKFCGAAKPAGSVFQRVSCGYLEQGKVAVIPCSFVSKLCLLCNFFCSLPLGRLPLSITVKHGVFFHAGVGSPVPMSLCSCLSWLKIYGSRAQFNGQILRSGKLSLLALADNCDLPAEYTRIDI